MRSYLGGTDPTQEDKTGDGSYSQMNSPLMLIEGFLQALTNTDNDGRIVITKGGEILVQYTHPPSNTHTCPQTMQVIPRLVLRESISFQFEISPP